MVTDLMDMSLSKLQEMAKARQSLACCRPRGHKESDTAEQLNNNDVWVRVTKVRKSKQDAWLNLICR